ncbi:MULTISPECIES: glycerol-3-phosphate 1-O-acyltransferase PlsB [unclassified Rhodanobacter]|uniref:glycerol-3-phosphate 1-O-acyltransferase PlsB n=1 Tax=unclassified Rhodanobacter TaxID=2621553 RepID=UPI0007AA1569|nr:MULTISPECIES: glycerol-3-phosphate 1-O-acyltransferase PlsB [unclassified Rhodanobacter]KZC15818.1 glycerol-3-phosphate 1-O-acyltransferase [Rhodanobacter sp. FW104-R8]KZC27856.1 glycerol-3-phosphate 1-O-acyltransferase [Rhodanobacter sp. FW510-T8]KZC32043.1 glycerol-3-phosphate 1-O-acyltransferase [Rhodanobacter sp. FW510-R10]
MPTNSTADSPARQRAPWWFTLAGQLLQPWVRIRRDPAEPTTLLQAGVPVCYVIERDGFSDALILQRACREAGLPNPMQPLAGTRRRRSVFALARRDGWLFGRNRRRNPNEPLRQLVRSLEGMPGHDIQIMPVSIYVGRAPSRDSGWFRVLFSENWVMVGRFRRMLALLLNGRDTVVHFSTPVSLRQMLDEAGTIAPERFARKVARVMRAHFHRIRAAVIGPDLSHRRTVVDAVLNAEPVRAAIAASAAKEKISHAKAWRKAHKLVLEIAADYSHPVVRSASFLLSNFWNKLYDGIAMHHFDKARAAAPGHEVIYVPCHRSHADYLLMSYQLHVSGVVVPHIAAGVNLNLPVIGPVLRRGGAFFLRRSFKGNALYSVVFNEYVAQLIDRGVPMEYFIEGGRSRTGRLLAPRAGMLVMTVRAFLRAPRRPVLFQPVYIGYEKLMEGKSYIGELSGQPKEKESLLGLLKGLKVLRQRYGHVALNFGEPIELTPLLDAASADWRAATTDPEAKPEWLNAVTDRLAEQIQININRAADVNPINLLALALLATPKHAMAESDLLTQLELGKAMLEELPYSDRVTLTPMGPAAIIAYGEQMGWIQRVQHPLGDVLTATGERAVLLSYFRNNVLHLTATAAWVACCFLNNRRMSRSSILRLGRIIYPFIQGELFLPWDTEGFAAQMQATIDFFVRRGLLESVSDGRVLERSPGQDDGAFQLKVIARSLIQAFERYYITIAALAKNGPHTMTGAELENACTLTAQRLSLLNELSAPEFFDKALFRGFIQKLRERHVVWTDDDGRLDYDAALEGMVRDARVILSREVRHSILKITPGGDREPMADQPAHVPADSDDAALHERHVAAEHHLHQASGGTGAAADPATRE